MQVFVVVGVKNDERRGQFGNVKEARSGRVWQGERGAAAYEPEYGPDFASMSLIKALRTLPLRGSARSACIWPGQAVCRLILQPPLDKLSSINVQ